MITKLSKSTACFFSANNLIEKEDEEVYAYGMELLLSTVFNLLIAVFIALITDTVFPCLVQLAAFVTLRIKAGGYHAGTHLGCMLIFTVTQILCVLAIKVINNGTMLVIFPITLITSAIIIFKYAPLEHPNKPLSDKKKKKLRKQSMLLFGFWIFFSLTFFVFGIARIGFYSGMGTFTVGVAIIAEKIKQGRCDAGGKI
jgi:accessory gene regulator B